MSPVPPIPASAVETATATTLASAAAGPIVTFDLYDVVRRLNRQRARMDPRFRGTKLREVVINSHSHSTSTTGINSGGGWKTVNLLNNNNNNDEDDGDGDGDGDEFERFEGPGEKVGFVLEPAAVGLTSELRTCNDNNNNNNNGNNNNNSNNNSHHVREFAPNPLPPHLAAYSPRELEAFYWQARAHDGCFRSLVALQHFLDGMPDGAVVKVQMRAKAGARARASAGGCGDGGDNAIIVDHDESGVNGERNNGGWQALVIPKKEMGRYMKIIELRLKKPKMLMVTCVLDEVATATGGTAYPVKGTMYKTGGYGGYQNREEAEEGEDVGMDHAVVGFSREPDGDVEMILDMSSMQFGSKWGKGCRGGGGVGDAYDGESWFVMESLDGYCERLEQIAEEMEIQKVSRRIEPAVEDGWLKEVAESVMRGYEEEKSVYGRAK